MLAFFGFVGEYMVRYLKKMFKRLNRIRHQIQRTRPSICDRCNATGHNADLTLCTHCNGRGRMKFPPPPEGLVQGFVTFSIVVFILFMGAVYRSLANRNNAADVVPQGESWSYLTGVYFACITYSTVGFGDYNFSAHTSKAAFTVVVVGMMVGMSLFATLLSSLQVRASPLGSCCCENLHNHCCRLRQGRRQHKSGAFLLHAALSL
eukprot:m.745149 g.745149  ORF g.745149 m.745149 type:complete len:206 (+) comp23126_c1_seq8:1141-1758(+)